MRKALITLSVVVFVLSGFGFAFGDEMAKEGSDSYKFYYTSTSQNLMIPKLAAVINYEARGVSGSDDKTSPFYMASIQCVGSVKGIKGVFKEAGLCTLARPDGGKIFMSYEASGKMGQPMKGSTNLIGGTENCDGITGTGEFTRTMLKGPAEGIGASVSIGKVSWKIP